MIVKALGQTLLWVTECYYDIMGDLAYEMCSPDLPVTFAQFDYQTSGLPEAARMSEGLGTRLGWSEFEFP